MIYSGRNIILILVLFLAVLVLYGNAANNNFMWDDRFLIEENNLLRAPLFSLQVFKQDIVNSAFTHTVYYRPIQVLSYAMDYRLWGIDPFGFHLTNILLHFVNGVLVFYLILILTGDKSVSFLSALLFIVHPAFQGVVAYISGRADLLCFMFGFLFLLADIHYRDSGKLLFLIAGSIFLLLSFLSKEYGLIFVLIFLLVDIAALRKRYIRGVFLHGINLGLAGIYMIFYRTLISGKALSEGPVSFSHISASAVKVFSEAIAVCLFPLNLHMRRSIENTNVFIVPASCIFLLMVLLFFILKKERRILMFSISFFAVSLFPICAVIKSFGVFAEHWIYLPSVGLFLFLSVILVDFFNRSKTPGKSAVTVIIAAAVIFYSTASISQGLYWSGGESLSDRVLDTSSGDSSAINFKALYAFEKGEISEAVNIASSQAETPRALYLRGRLKIASGNVNGAYEDFSRAVELNPGYDNGYLGMAFVSFSREDPEGGTEYLEKVIELNPRHPEALFLLGMIYSKEGNDRKALHIAIMAYKSDPYGYNTLLNLGTAYTRNGYLKEGAETYLRAVNIYPERPKAYYNLGQIFFISGDKKEALYWAKRCLEVDPSFEPALKMLHKLKRQ